MRWLEKYGESRHTVYIPKLIDRGGMNLLAVDPVSGQPHHRLSVTYGEG